MKNCPAHAVKDTSLNFRLALADQEEIVQSDNSTEVDSAPLEIVLTT